MRRDIHLGAVIVLAAVTGLAALSPAGAEVVQRGHLRVSFEGKLTPHVLPRSGMAPVTVSVSGKIATTDGGDPPQLRRITIQINRNGRLDRAGLPVCHIEQIQPASDASALEACGEAKVGEGNFTSDVLLPSQAPFPSIGKVLAFNGVFHGRPAILAHVYGTEPLPTSYTLPFLITARKQGTFGIELSASLPEVTSEWGYVTGMSMSLGHTSRTHGRVHAYLSAGCPAPKGFPGATFPFAHVSMSFAKGHDLATTLVRSCNVGGADPSPGAIGGF